MATKPNTTNTTPETPETPETAPIVKPMPKATFDAIVRDTTNLATIERGTALAIDAIAWERLPETLAAMYTLGTLLLGSKVGGKLTGKVNSTTITDAFADETSPLYVADAIKRALLPSVSTVSRAIDVATLHTDERVAAYLALPRWDGIAGAKPIPQDVILWMKLDAGAETLGNRSTVIVAETVSVDADGKRTVGALVREAVQPRGPKTEAEKQAAKAKRIANAKATLAAAGEVTAVAVESTWGEMETWTDEQLVAVSPAADMTAFSDVMVEAIARQAIARLLLTKRGTKASALLQLNAVS